MSDAETQIGFEQLGLGAVLKQNQLAVPPNQREYSWTEREVTTLLQDFAKAIADGERGYFMGTVVTIPRMNGVLEVVDGQQRLATTAILLSAIRDYLTGREPMIAESIENEFLTVIDRKLRDRVPRLQLNLDDNDFFRAKLIGKGPQPAPARLSHKRLETAFIECRAQVAKIVAGLADKDHGDILNQWIGFLEKAALVVLLRVPNDANAYKMFETLNDRGLKTSQSDLVKNYLFARSGDRLPEVQQKWAYMKGVLETLSDDDITITFLRHALIAIQGFIRESQVYEGVQGHAKSAQLVIAFANNLELLANSYVAIFNPEHDKWNKYSDSTRRAIEVLNLFGIVPIRPLMLAIAQKFSEKETEKAFKCLVSMGVRLMIASSTRSGSVEEPIAAAANKVFVGEIKTADEICQRLESITPNDQAFRGEFETARISNSKLARYLLRSLEMAAKDEGEPWHIPNDDKSVINLEHVLPKRPEANWPQFTPDEVEIYTNRLGNQVLLRASDNSTMHSDSFDKKKPVFAASPYILTSQIAAEANWTAESISRRQKTLAAYALKAWPT
jgi:hypothetical protein